MYKSLHFIGVGGIGMSSLAAMYREHGCRVTGSDRAAGKHENARIFDALSSRGVQIFPQDGSFIASGTPDAVVYSTAIEEDNPDLAAARTVKRLHRSELISDALNTLTRDKLSIAVTGSCGKSTVTALVSETLYHLGADPVCLNGALIKRFSSPGFAGNYRHGNGKYFVFESDESDKSLLNYSSDYAVILNLGTDHYDKDELTRVFGEFLKRTRHGAVLGGDVYRALKAKNLLPAHLTLRVFGEAQDAGITDCLVTYQPLPQGKRQAVFSGNRRLMLPQPGRFNALNALAVSSLLEMLGFARNDALQAIEKFSGVWRRNDFAGLTAAGAMVYDDYAHNPEKIAGSLGLMQEIAGETGRVFAVFQPHGYGPFGFMADALAETLKRELRSGDVFYLMEPYYAGGTSSFKPTAQEVMTKWLAGGCDGSQFRLGTNRDGVKLEILREAKAGDVICILGARDNSLSGYAASFAGKDGRK